jgi:dTDP-3-amino-3,4,6-trideoxy-alpha-D-glucose transaminase
MVHLSEQGIQTAVHYPVPVHLQPAYAHRLPGWQSLPVTEEVCPRIVSLPLYPELTDEQIGRVATSIATFFSRSV